MPDINFARINGVPYSWTSMAHLFQGVPYKGLVAVDWAEKRDGAYIHAAQQDGVPIGITSGIYEVESFTFRMLRSTGLSLMADLTILGLGSYGDASFNYINQLFEPALQVPPDLPASVLITGCKIIGVKDKGEVGIDGLITEFTCKASLIERTVAGVPLSLWSPARTLLP